MATLRRIKLNELNEHITCTLCQGYYVEATTIIECLHTFCRTCIVRYLDTSTFCPVCEVQVHKTKPLQSLREDKTLQDVVYKLVPNLYREEMQRRMEFYQEHPQAGGDRTEQSLKEKRHFFHVDDQISLSLEFLPPAHAHAHALGLRPLRGPTLLDQKDQSEKEGFGDSEPEPRVPHKRYMKCQAAVQIRLLEKFIRLKYALSDAHRVDIVHGSDCLSPELTLLDVVYTYKYTEDYPLNLQYTVIAPPPNLKRKKEKLTSKAASCNIDPQPKRQKLDNSLSDVERKDALKSDNELSRLNQAENNIIPSDSSLPGRDDCDNNMLIDEPTVEIGNESGNKSNTNLDSSTFVKETLKNCDSNSGSEANSSIESLKKFVNNAPGLVGFQSDSVPNNAPSTRVIENVIPQSKDIQNSSPQPSTSIALNVTVAPEIINSNSQLISTSTPITYAAPTVNTTCITSVRNCTVSQPVVPNIRLQTPDGSVMQPHISSPRVVLHRPSNVGFPQARNIARYNNVLTTSHPDDPTRPRLGRPPNAARVAAAAAGRAIPQPILPRGPSPRNQFPHKPILPSKVDNRGRPRKKLLINNKPIANNVPVNGSRQPNDQLNCSTINSNISTNSKVTSKNMTTQQNSVDSSTVIATSSCTMSTVAKSSNSLINTICESSLKVSSASPKTISSVAATRPLTTSSKVNKSIGLKPTGSTSRLSSIADLLVSKQLSQLSSPKVISESSNNLPTPMSLPKLSTPAGVPPVMQQICSGVPFLPAVNPALCAAYMSEYNNVSNWLKISQTAAVIRDMQALANQRTSPSSKNDATPMDLSPTNKNNLSSSVPSTTKPSVPGLTNSLNYIPNSVANCIGTSPTTATNMLTKSVIKPLLNPRLPVEDHNSLDMLINSKFNTNNNISPLGSKVQNRNKNVLENYAKSVTNFPTKVESALNNSRLTKCTSNNQSRISINQVPLKANSIVPRKNGMTTSIKSISDKTTCNGSPILLNNAVNSMKLVKSPNCKASNDTRGSQRSSPTPAIAPAARSIGAEGLHSVPSPKAAQSASPNSPSIPSATISPPTPEVTITKLPNSSVSSSVSYVATAASNQSSISVGKITHTNTVSITKRPSASIVSVANKLAVRSPSASVRQIPNPSLLSQKSQVRNNKNVRVDN